VKAYQTSHPQLEKEQKTVTTEKADMILERTDVHTDDQEIKKQL
jgi:hypothetical protein